jgi:hypothetical protein
VVRSPRHHHRQPFRRRRLNTLTYSKDTKYLPKRFLHNIMISSKH